MLASATRHSPRSTHSTTFPDPRSFEDRRMHGLDVTDPPSDSLHRHRDLLPVEVHDVLRQTRTSADVRAPRPYADLLDCPEWTVRHAAQSPLTVMSWFPVIRTARPAYGASCGLRGSDLLCIQQRIDRCQAGDTSQRTHALAVRDCVFAVFRKAACRRNTTTERSEERRSFTCAWKRPANAENIDPTGYPTVADSPIFRSTPAKPRSSE